MNNTKLRFQDISLRKASAEDLEPLYQLMTVDEEWTKYNGPYFGYVRPTLSEFKQQQFQKFLAGDKGLVIDYLGRAIGSVSYYWEDENTRWLEAGVAIYDSSLWGRGIGLKALIPWVEHLFATLEIERVGFTTWS
jgi:RimJ/RimL family protein N-acetyltransferase